MAADLTATTASTAALGAEYAETASAAYRAALEVIESVEPRIAAATRKELADQRDSLKLITSENYASPAVLLTMGTWFSDKYAEGTIGHRFYAACQNVDTVEVVAAAAREFKPLILVAGYSAYPRRVNFAKMREIADEVGATLMVDMAHFAGLVAGKVFTGDEDPVPHAHVTTTTTHKSLRGPRGGLVLATEEYSSAVDKGCPMVLGGPLSHVMAAKAVALAEARQPAFGAYAQRVADNAKALAEGFLKRGPRLVTGGTDNHLVLLDVTSFGLTGRQAESALLDSGVVTNRNSIPADPNGAWYTSGVRIGTPALTSRGFGADDFDRVAELIVDVLTATTPTAAPSGGASKAKYSIAEGVAAKTHDAAAEMLDANPLYPGLELGAAP